MNWKRGIAVFLLLALGQTSFGNQARISDWPQWQGPQRTGLSTETGLLKEWPTNGPKAMWEVKSLGAGYGSMAIQGNSILVQGTSGDKSVVFCLNRASGEQVWMARLGPSIKEGRGHGPRGTPTIDGELVYVLTRIYCSHYI